MVEKVLPYKCRCGGTLKKSETFVEFFSIDFGMSRITLRDHIGVILDHAQNSVQFNIKIGGILT